MPAFQRPKKKKQLKTNPRIEEALKKIQSYRLDSFPSEDLKQGEETSDKWQQEEQNAGEKSVSERLDDAEFLLDTLQITQQEYEKQRDAILATRNQEKVEPLTDAPSSCNSQSLLNNNLEKPPAEYSENLRPFIFGDDKEFIDAKERSSSSPTQESEQGSTQPMTGLFQEGGVYKTAKEQIELGGDNDLDNVSDDDSDASLRDIVDGEIDDDGSLSSNDSEEWNNELEILAMKNKEKNKEVLRELYLDEIEGRPITPLASPNTSSGKSNSPTSPVGGPPSALKSSNSNTLPRVSSCVNFSEHDKVQEYEIDSKYNVIPLSMDPEEIYPYDRQTSNSSDDENKSPEGMNKTVPKRNPSFIKPEYTTPSKMSLQKKAKKGSFLAAMKNKKKAASNPTTPSASDTSVDISSSDTKVQDSSSTVTVENDQSSPKIETPSPKPLLPRDSLLLYKDNVAENMPDKDTKRTEDNSHHIGGHPDLKKSTSLPSLPEVVQEDNDIVVMKDKLNKLLEESPEFRAKVLSFPEVNKPNSKIDDVFIEQPPKKSPSVEDKQVYPQNEAEGKSSASDSSMEQQKAMDSRIAKWNERLGLDLEDLTNNLSQEEAKQHIDLKSQPRPGSMIEQSEEMSSSSGSSVPTETRSAAFARLTQPKVYTSPSVELAKPPPISGTMLLNLPCDDVQELVEKCEEEKSFIIHLEPNEEKLRIKAKATENVLDWEHSNKLAYYGLNFNRSEFMEFDEDIIPSHPNNENHVHNEIETCTNGRVKQDRFARGMAPLNPNESKKKLLISHEEAYDFLYINRLKLLRKVRPHLAQMDTFCNKYFVSFICLVFDLKMQLLGTYDHKLGKYFPGVVVCPPHTQRQKRRRDIHRYCNVLEIDFNKLPVDTFAVVPVVCDVSPRTAEFPGLHLQLNVAVNSTEENFRRAFENTQKSDQYDSESLSSSIQEQFEVEKSVIPPLVEDDDDLKESDTALPAHIDVNFVDANWTHVESFFAERLSTLPDSVGMGPEYSINYNQTRSKTIPLNNRSSFVPFVLFRRYDLSQRGSATGERLWSLKGIQRTFDGILPHVVARNVLDIMKESYIMPIHHINVEHCINCDAHKSTTWHVPGSYEKKFEELRTAIRLSLPPCIVTSNKFTSDKGHIPRIGSFDVTVRPFFSDISQLLHSKVISKQFPVPDKMITELATLLLPEQVTFKGVHTLELHVYDGYDRIPLKGAHVKLYRVEVNPACDTDLACKLSNGHNSVIEEEDCPGTDIKTTVATNWLLSRGKKREKDKDAEGEEKHNTGMPQIPRDSIAYKKKRNLGKGFTSLMLESKSLEAAKMRHSKSFFNVRTWRKEEVAKWIKSYGLTDQIVQAATYDGAVDGPTLISIANVEAFQRWGIKSRIKLSQMLKSLEELKQDHTGNIVTSYDPYTYNELLEGAADRHAPSPLYSEPASPRRSKNSQDIMYYPVGSKKTNRYGLCFMNVDVLGSYMLRIESPLCTPYCSHAFQINSSGHSAFCASLNPKIGLAKIRVKLENGMSEENFEGVDEAGILVSMVNLHNGKRHITVVKYDHPTKTNVEEQDEDFRSRTMRNHFSEGNIVSSKKQLSPQTTQRKTLKRDASAGNLLMKGLIDRKQSRTSIVERNTSINKMKMASAKVVDFYCTADIYLPVGKYYSEVDGSVFTVEPTRDEDCSDESWENASFKARSTENSIICNSFNSDSDYLEYTEAQTRKCHRRIVMSSVRAFQKIYRRYKKNFLRDNIWAYLTLKRSFRVVLKRIRAKIAHRHTVKIQSNLRMLQQKKKFREQRKKTVICASIMRRFIAKKRMKQVFFATELVKRFVRGWLRRRRQRRYRATLIIQLFVRRVFAREEYVRMLFKRRLSKRAKRYVKFIRKQLKEKKRIQEELCREQAERILMDAEHYRVINFAIEKEEYEKAVIRRKLLEMEKRIFRTATVVQKVIRGFLYRLKFKRFTRAVIILQKRLRLYLFEEQLKKKPPVSSGKQRFIAYCPSFPSLKKSPQLLGATKLLQGMYDKEALETWLMKKNMPPDEDDAVSLTSSEFKAERKRSFVENLLHRVLNGPATKISSIMLMNRDRNRYINRWQEAREITDEYPPLFRYMHCPDVSYPLEEDEVENDKIVESTHEENQVAPEANAKPSVKKKFASLMPLLKVKSSFNKREDLPLQNKKEVQGGTKDTSVEQSAAYPAVSMKKNDNLSHQAATCIQKWVRGHIVRKNLSASFFNEENKGDDDDDISAITKVTIAKASSFSMPKRQFSNVSQSMSKTIKRGLSNVSLKSFSSSSKVKQISRSMSTGISRMNSATALMKEKYEEKAEVKKEFKAQQAVQNERQRRLENHEVNVEDAILHITGWNESQLPRLNRKWYICAFPRLAGEGPEKVMRKNKFTETNFYQNVLSKNSETYEEENEHLEYEMSNNRFPGEAVRSCDLAPLSRESFEKLNFNVHLTDYLRYSRVHLVVYIQTGEEGGDDANAVRPDALPRDTSVPTIRHLHIDKKDMPAYFLPAFHGTVVMNQGKAFTPCGGRLNVNLTPIPNQAIYLSRAQAKRLALMKGIRIAATLSPVAVPSADFLYPLLCKQTPPPTYPSEILDALVFEKNELDLKEFYGAALCMVRFKERNLVSTRHRGVPHGVLEFDGDGEVIGKAVEHKDAMGTITSMVAGFEHLLCCGSTGHLAVYVQDVKEGDEDISLAPSRYSNVSSLPEDARLLTSVRTISDLHKAPVVSCAAVHRAGMDIFFTLDKSDNIGVIVMERGICLRSYLNESFVTFHVTSFVASLDRLYLGLSSGIVVTINLSEIMNGNVHAAGNLRDHILGRDVIFSKEAGISTMAIMSQHDFFGSYNEDVSPNEVVDVPPASTTRRGKKQSKMGNDSDSDSDSDDGFSPLRRSKSGSALRGLQRNKLQGDINDCSTGEIAINPKCVKLPNPPLEGHIILVAGGDKDPRIKILLPLNKRKKKEKDLVDDPDIGFGFREIYVLPGHSRATTQIVVDASGRFIISSSNGSRQMCIWNALTENCEITHENVNAAFIGLSNNALFMCSFKAPFLTIWKPKPPPDPKKRYRKKIEMDDGRFMYEKMPDIEPSIDGRPEIGFVRGNVWSMNTIQGGLKTPNRSLAETDFFLGGNGRGRYLVDFWKRNYDRGVKTISKLAPPTTLKSKKHLNPKGAMAKGLRSMVSLQRQITTVADTPTQHNALSNDGDVHSVNNFPFDRPAESFDKSPSYESPYQEDTPYHETPYHAYDAYEKEGGHKHAEQNMGNLREDSANYNSYYGCYYDHAGNPYNYDEHGNMYYYYNNSNDFATDTSVKQMSEYDMGTTELNQPSLNEDYNRQHSVESFDEQPSIDIVAGESSVQFEEPQVDETISANNSASSCQDIFPYPHTFHHFDESFRTSSRYEEGFNDDSYDENFSANNGLHFNQPQRSYSPGNTLSVLSSQRLPRIKKNENLDEYGFNKKTNLEAERDDEEYFNFRQSSSQSRESNGGMYESASFLKKNPLSRRRRHMHMSDSEESEDEKLTSIYKSKRTEIRLKKEMDEKLQQIDPNSFGYDEQVSHIRNTYGFPESIDSVESFDANEGMGYDKVHEDVSNIIQDDSYVSGQTTDEASILSITNERKNMMAKRKQLLKRRVLYQIDGDESD